MSLNAYRITADYTVAGDDSKCGTFHATYQFHPAMAEVDMANAVRISARARVAESLGVSPLVVFIHDVTVTSMETAK